MNIASVRDSGPMRALGAGLTFWAAMFAVFALLTGNKVTTGQWLYLFSVPGGYYSWAAMFGTSALVSAWGLWTRRYRVAAVGMFGTGTGCLAIAALYLMAPLFGDELITMGWTPWVLGAGVFYYLTAQNWTDRAW